MENLTFNKKQFIRSLLIFVLLMSIWTMFSIITNQFAENDKGFVTGFGFLAIFSASLHFGHGKVSIINFLHLLIAIILLYCFSSFILSALILGIINSFIIYTIVNSIFVSIVMTLILDRLYKIEFKRQTILFSVIIISASYLLHKILGESLYSLINLQPGISIFIFFQSFAIIPLLLGLTLKKKACI